MIKIILSILLFYFLYKLVFDFIVPVSKATSQVRNNIEQMQKMQQDQYRQQQQQQQAQAQAQAAQQRATAAPKSKSDDYIDFEEVKS